MNTAFKNIMRRLFQVDTFFKYLFAGCALVGTNDLYGQTYTGFFYGPHPKGAYTDDYLNIKPQSGTTDDSNWNVYHKDNSSLLSVKFVTATPAVSIGVGRTTDLYVNGNVGIGTTSPQARLHVNGEYPWRSNGWCFTRSDRRRICGYWSSECCLCTFYYR